MAKKDFKNLEISLDDHKLVGKMALEFDLLYKTVLSKAVRTLYSIYKVSGTIDVDSAAAKKYYDKFVKEELEMAKKLEEGE